MINSFRGPYRFLSNFYPHRIEYNNIIYPSNEHAFQAQKTNDLEKRKIASLLSSPTAVKKYGRLLFLRSDWDTIRIPIMFDLNRIKFSDPILSKKLIGTGDQELIEGNYWGDTFWGICNGEGQNNLGRILMQIRKEIQ